MSDHSTEHCRGAEWHVADSLDVTDSTEHCHHGRAHEHPDGRINHVHDEVETAED